MAVASLVQLFVSGRPKVRHGLGHTRTVVQASSQRCFEARWPELLEPAARCRYARGIGVLSEAATTVLKSTIRPDDPPFTTPPKVITAGAKSCPAQTRAT